MAVTCLLITLRSKLQLFEQQSTALLQRRRCRQGDMRKRIDAALRAASPGRQCRGQQQVLTGVGDAVAGVKHDAGGAAGGVQGQHGLDGHVHGGHVEGLKHDLSHLLAIGLGVERGLRQQHRVLLGRHAQLVVEGVVPDLLHVIPAAKASMSSRKDGGTRYTLTSKCRIDSALPRQREQPRVSHGTGSSHAYMKTKCPAHSVRIHE